MFECVGLIRLGYEYRTPNNTRVKEILEFVLKLWIQKSTLQFDRPTWAFKNIRRNLHFINVQAIPLIIKLHELWRTSIIING